jgi:plasmid stabilization system protein ParE
MARILVTPTAASDFDRLITTHSLPADTTARFKRSIAALAQFPLIGAPLDGHWADYRFVLGPWRWVIVAYVYDETLDQVAIVTVQDGRTSRAATSV